jgi:hypothetical protein
MKSDPKHDEVFERAMTGLPRIARTIIEMPADERPKALHAVEHSYRKTARGLGFGESQARGWATVVMASLRAEMRSSLKIPYGR